MRYRLGDRRRKWKQSCCIGGTIMLAISGFFILAGITADKGGWIVIVFGIVGIFCALLDFRAMKRGWKIRYDLPSSYYRDIKSSNPITREIARKAAENTLKAAKNPKRKRHAFMEGE